MKPEIAALLQHKAAPSSTPTLYRIMRARHKSTPLATGPGSSRFSSPNGIFTVMYTAPELHTCVMEAILRDRMENTYPRIIHENELHDFCVAEIITQKKPTLLHLTKKLCVNYSKSTDIIGGKDHAPGQKLSEELFDDPDLDGMLFQSRFSDSAICQVNYDRSISTLQSTTVTPFVEMNGLTAIFRDLNIAIARTRR